MGSWYQFVNFGGQLHLSTVGTKVDGMSTFRDVLAGQMQDLELEKQLVDRQACIPQPFTLRAAE